MAKHIIIPCPFCEGTGKKFDTNIKKYINQNCTACEGSKIYDSVEGVGGPRAEQRKNAKAKEELMSKSACFSDFVKFCQSHGFTTPTREAAHSLRSKIKKKGNSLLKW